MSFPKVTIEALVNAPVEKVWDRFTQPEYITQWNFASDTWECPTATNDLRTGGSFSYRMQAKDGSFGFDFGGTYTAVEPLQRITYTMEDGRTVETTFTPEGEGTKVTTVFDAENENAIDMQRSGWQAILDNFKKVAEQA